MVIIAEYIKHFYLVFPHSLTLVSLITDHNGKYNLVVMTILSKSVMSSAKMSDNQALRDFQIKKYTITVVSRGAGSRGAGSREQGENKNILSRKLDNLFSGSP
ncbi:hypothetical protein CLI64_07985 [Nostoc sp. CENA543]|nr:hypothetical protein CLI64_07985 [Nostoc sp. CENA543]